MIDIKLLLDANISWRSIKILNQNFAECCHVDSIGLPVPATDMQIWEYARMHGFIIVTNDEDFLNMVLFRGFPPKVILLKTGNQSRERLEEILITSAQRIEDFSNSLEYGLLEII